jgi:alkanesulfonate monooxygenase SsuD/methylene tetrahydromethanopterin reductase-like flavin-dependent oxidoreductase (luciferase family)
VKGHNERRFSVPWSAPVPRLREYVESLRAIWRCWEKQEPLRYEGEHYRFTLMTPEFSPPPSGLPGIPVSIAAVGPDMLKLAGRVCDGVRLHGFATRKYLEEVALPQIETGLKQSGRPLSAFEVWGGGFVLTGADEPSSPSRSVRPLPDRLLRLDAQLRGARRPQLGGSGASCTPCQRGQWRDGGGSRRVVRTFAAVGTYREIASAIADRAAASATP